MMPLQVKIFTVVGYKSGTVAIDVHFHFERAICHWKTYFIFALTKWRGDLFDKKRCGANKTFLLMTRQFICAPNVRSVKRCAVQTRKKSAILKLFHNLRCEFYPHRHWRRELPCALAPLFAPHPLMSKLSLIHFDVTSGNGNNTFYSKTACSNWK